jgi:hypothetical protein
LKERVRKRYHQSGMIKSPYVMRTFGKDVFLNFEEVRGRIYIAEADFTSFFR